MRHVGMQMEAFQNIVEIKLEIYSRKYAILEWNVHWDTPTSIKHTFPV